MKKCPGCGKLSVDYDSYHKVEKCYIDGCSVRIVDNNSYSVLRADPIQNTMQRIKVKDGVDVEVLKTYRI